MNNFTSVRLEITSKCNLNCKYCHNLDFANKNDDMSTEEIKKLIYSLKDLGVNKILLTGGEPLLNPDIIEIVQLLTDLNIKSDLVTNGKLLSYELINKLANAGLKRIRISIDGLGEEHSKYRIGSNPDILWEKCKYIKENTKINTVVHTVSSSHNASSMFDIYQKLLENKIDRWRVFDVGYEGAANKNIKDLNIATYYLEFMDQMAKIISHYIQNNLTNKLDMEINGVFKTNLITKQAKIMSEEDRLAYLESIKNLSPCAYIQHQSTIRSNGIGTLCQFFHNDLYNYRKYNFDVKQTLSNKKTFKENEIILNDIIHCKNCKYVIVCNSGCRAKANYLTGNVTNPDPVFCVLLPLLYKKIVPVLPIEAQNSFYSYLNRKGKDPLYTSDDLSLMIEKNIRNR